MNDASESDVEHQIRPCGGHTVFCQITDEPAAVTGGYRVFVGVTYGNRERVPGFFKIE